MNEPPDSLIDFNSPAAAAANLRAILNTVVDAIVTISERGEIRMANQAAGRMFGYEPAELIGRNVGMLMPPPYDEEHDGYLQRYLETGKARIIGVGREVTARKKDGTLFPLDLSVSEVRIGESRMFTGVMRDMTDRRRTEEQLEHERVFSDSLLKTANAIVVVLDEQGRIARVNDYVEHLSGYSSNELRGKDWVRAFVPSAEQEAIRDLFRVTLGGTPVHSHVNSILTRTGEERQIAW
jgi:PAS domain S-box-containing protein